MTTKSEAPLDLGPLHRLKSTEPPVWLAPNVVLSDSARAASRQLFSFLKSHAPKSPLDQLLIEGFDAEQIWQQIDLQSQPLLSGLRREVKKFEKNPDEIGKIRKVLEGEKKHSESEREVAEEESDGFDDELDDEDDDEEDEDEEEEKEGAELESEKEGSESEEKEEKGKGGGIEDEFLKINELEQYLEEDEAREYGLKNDVNNAKKKRGRKVLDDEDEDEDEDEGGEDEEDDEDDVELGVFDEGDEDGDMGKLGTARYEDFFGAKMKKVSKKKSKPVDGSEEESSSDEDEEEKEEEEEEETMEIRKNKNLSTHEKELQKLQSEIEQMEKANLDSKAWTMQGEVTAAQRPKNSALEVDLDFQHNVRPAPVITEEFTASLEEMIKKRVLEGQFDDVQKILTLPSKAPRELKELDENKSKKGLAEVYEEEYVQKTDPAAAPLLFSDEQKKGASMLFKILCLKLDALSHFHFTPKPVIEDMSIQTNVPALAMEEIAPIAVSDAAMLAPEEVFAGKGNVKEEAELTQAERKRRRANKKRRFKAKAAERTAKRARDNLSLNHNADNEE